MRRLAIIAFAAALAPAPTLAQSKVLYSNDFNATNGGQTARGINQVEGFSTPDFGIVPPPTVDLVHTGDGLGITCRGLSGGCLDLDGTTNSAGLLFSDATYGFKPGDLFTLKYSISGSQRAGYGTDGYHLGYNFDDLTTFFYQFQTSSGKNESGFLTDYGLTVSNSLVPFDMPFVDVTLTFRPVSRVGSFFLSIDGYSGATNAAGVPVDSDNDNVGLILDDISLVQSAVPEPATWLTMIGGFGLLGALMRRRRGKGAHLVVRPLRI